MNLRIFAPLILIASTVLAYHRGLDGPFIFDDENAIVENHTIRRLWPVWRPLLPPPASSVGGRPVVNFSFALNYSVGKLEPRGYHVANLILHALNTWLIYAVVRRTLAVRQLHGASRSPSRSGSRSSSGCFGVFTRCCRRRFCMSRSVRSS